MLAVIPCQTDIINQYSRILMLKIQGEFEAVVFNMYPSSQNTETDLFDGEITIATLQGEILRAFRVQNGEIISILKSSNHSSKNTDKNYNSPSDPENVECRGWCGHEASNPNCICNMQHLDEVIINGTTPIEYISITDLYGSDASDNDGIDNTWNSGGGGTGSNESNDFQMESDTEKRIDDMEEFLKCFDKNLGATITIYVDQPVANSPQTANAKDKAGHSFVSISQNDNISVFGFYPVGTASPWNPTMSSTMQDDSNHGFDVSISIVIPPLTASHVLNLSLNYTSTYDLNNYNCTDFAIQIANLCGLNISECNTSWIDGYGSAPSILGQFIRNMPNSNGYNINKNGGTSPKNKKDC